MLASFWELLIESLINNLVWFCIYLGYISLNLLRLNTLNGSLLGHSPLSVLVKIFLAPLHLLRALIDHRPKWLWLLLLHLVLLNISINVSWRIPTHCPQILLRTGYLHRFFVKQWLEVKSLLLILLLDSISQIVVTALFVMDLIIHELL